ncbi:MAG: nuclear transport factor 2 family protein [Actinomycetota bacterium]|nr:nuclear transport factor 2 family protein [Actinomycetota bacterium]
MEDEEIRQLLEDHWERHANSNDFEAAHAIYHEDAVLEWPQSGERFIGKETFRAMREGAPPLEFKTWRIMGSGDFWTAENLMRVAGGEPSLTANILEFRDGKVVKEVVYITQPFEASADRAQWAERFEI